MGVFRYVQDTFNGHLRAPNMSDYTHARINACKKTNTGTDTDMDTDTGT